MTDTAPDAPEQPGFETWANLYATHQAFSHPSELHGGLCGRLAAGSRLSMDDWLTLACEHMGIAPETAKASQELEAFLCQAYDRTLASLQASDLSFQPLLPDEDYALQERLQSLSAWVRGFLEGMALVATQELGEATGETRELVEDFVAISQVAEGDSEGNESEQHWIEIAEYVRVGVLTLFMEFNPPMPAPSTKETLH
jgi:hypothetical protein